MKEFLGYKNPMQREKNVINCQLVKREGSKTIKTSSKHQNQQTLGSE